MLGAQVLRYALHTAEIQGVPVQTVAAAEGVTVDIAVVQGRRGRVQADRQHRTERRQVRRQRQTDVLRQDRVQRWQLGRARPRWRKHRRDEPRERAGRWSRRISAGDPAGRLQQARVKGQLAHTCKQDSAEPLLFHFSPVEPASLSLSLSPSLS